MNRYLANSLIQAPKPECGSRSTGLLQAKSSDDQRNCRPHLVHSHQVTLKALQDFQHSGRATTVCKPSDYRLELADGLTLSACIAILESITLARMTCDMLRHLRESMGGLAAAAIVIAMVLWRADIWPAHGTSELQPGQPVAVHVFNSRGELIGPVESPAVVLGEEQWRERLAPEQFKVLHRKGTEAAFCGRFHDNHQEGVYACRRLRSATFFFRREVRLRHRLAKLSTASRTGQHQKARRRRHRHVSRRSAVRRRCEGHLGHLFDDGPAPRGLRFCLNSAATVFVPTDQLETLADPAAE